jgi:hypothetical protein
MTNSYHTVCTNSLKVMKSRNVKRSRKTHDRSNDGKDDKETKKMKKCVTIESPYFTRSKSKRLLK